MVFVEYIKSQTHADYLFKLPLKSHGYEIENQEDIYMH